HRNTCYRQQSLQKKARWVEAKRMKIGQTEMKQGARAIWVSGIIHSQQPEIAIEFMLLRNRILVPSVVNLDIAPKNFVTEVLKTRPNLFVDAAAPTNACIAPE